MLTNLSKAPSTTLQNLLVSSKFKIPKTVSPPVHSFRKQHANCMWDGVVEFAVGPYFCLVRKTFLHNLAACWNAFTQVLGLLIKSLLHQNENLGLAFVWKSFQIFWIFQAPVIFCTYANILTSILSVQFHSFLIKSSLCNAIDRC